VLHDAEPRHLRLVVHERRERAAVPLVELVEQVPAGGIRQCTENNVVVIDAADYR